MAEHARIAREAYELERTAKLRAALKAISEHKPPRPGVFMDVAA